LVSPPVSTERSTPHRDSAEKPTFASAATGQQDQAPHRLGRQRHAAGAFAIQINLARLGADSDECGHLFRLNMISMKARPTRHPPSVRARLRYDHAAKPKTWHPK
jgi:hypothetical protein